MAETKGVRTVNFDGKSSSYVNWSQKFLCLCVIKDCSTALTEDHPSSMPKEGVTLTTTNDADGKYEARRKANNLAYAMMMLSQNDNITLRALSSAVTDTFTKGDARLAWKNLEQLHKPKDDATKFELINRFNRMDLRSESKTPDEWFAEIDSLRAQLKIDYKHDIPDDEIVSHIIYNLHPRTYQTLLTMVKRELNNKTKVLLEDLSSCTHI